MNHVDSTIKSVRDSPLMGVAFAKMILLLHTLSLCNRIRANFSFSFWVRIHSNECIYCSLLSLLAFYLYVVIVLFVTFILVGIVCTRAIHVVWLVRDCFATKVPPCGFSAGLLGMVTF